MRLQPALAACRSAVRNDLADLPASALVLVACSGGADSLALAAAALHVGSGRGWRVGTVTVDHRLQPAAAQVAARVAVWARAAGADPVEVVPVEPAGPGGPEASARAARYAALDAVADRYDAAAVLLGHTRDDQAETVLLGLARGAGARSLAGMASRRGRYRRPYLALPRAATVAACAALGLTPWSDPHNTDPSYTRARVRTTALPALEAALGPGVPAALARSARLLRADADALDAQAGAAYDELRGPAGLPVDTLRVLSDAVRWRVLRRAALAAGVPAGPLTADHVLALDALATDWHGQGPIALPSAYIGVRGCGFLRICRPDDGER